MEALYTEIHLNPLINIKGTGRNSFTLSIKCDVTKPPIFSKATLFRQLFVKKPEEYHENPTNVLVADARSQIERQTDGNCLHIRRSFRLQELAVI